MFLLGSDHLWPLKTLAASFLIYQIPAQLFLFCHPKFPLEFQLGISFLPALNSVVEMCGPVKLLPHQTQKATAFLQCPVRNACMGKELI